MDVLNLCGFHIVFESTEVVLAEFSLVLGAEALFLRWIGAWIVLFINGFRRRTGEVFAEEIF